VDLAEAKEAAKMENKMAALQKKLELAEQKQREAEEKLASGAAPAAAAASAVDHGVDAPPAPPQAENADGFVNVGESQQLMDESGRMLE
jgi:hypothetical protein